MLAFENGTEFIFLNKFEQNKITSWTGVRNYQARNFIREMKKVETFLFYHSDLSQAL